MRNFCSTLIKKIIFRQKVKGSGIVYSQGIAWNKRAALVATAQIGEDDVMSMIEPSEVKFLTVEDLESKELYDFHFYFWEEVVIGR